NAPIEVKFYQATNFTNEIHFMNEFNEMNPDELLSLHLEAMSYYLAFRMRHQEIILEELCKIAGAKPDNKTVADFLRDRTAESFQNFLRTIADHDPDKASKMSWLFEALQRGDFRGNA
ncbi:MAG: hypothetical protein KGL39_60710, partial [Patescibacteria group bacterium]|nr:hypothetical protein [Patescibacteria group bacterium]